METIEIKTLVDITNANVRRMPQGTQLELEQTRNWTTLLQGISMRANVELEGDPIVTEESVAGMGFGTKYTGKHKVWTFRFVPERESAYDDGSGDSLQLLKADLDKIPMIFNLTETINTNKAVLLVADKQYTNIVVTAC